MSDRRNTILIVDDVETNRAILRSMFEGKYRILEAENGEQAMLLVNQLHDTFAAVLLDLVMPVMDGYEVMKAINNAKLLSEFPVIIITADNTIDNEIQAFDLGASDIIMKPFEPSVVLRRVNNSIELSLYKLNLEELVEEQAAEIMEANAVVIDTLTSIIEYRNVETGQHNRRIRVFTKALIDDVAERYPEYGLTKSKISLIVNASSLHDIGKIAIPDSILIKPDKLTDEEYETMKLHTVKGADMLAKLTRMGNKEYLSIAQDICKYHHERWDGTGYPEGLKGDDIPISAQIVSIADCYDALTRDRVYKNAIPSTNSLNMIVNGECGEFSPKLLKSLEAVAGEFEEIAVKYADEKEEFEPNVKNI